MIPTLQTEVLPEAFARLDALAFPHSWGVDAFHAGPDALACSLWNADECVCFVYGRQVLDEVELWRIATHPDHRRRGLGARVYKAFAETCRARGAVRVFLEVAADNIGAVALYRRMGFEKAGVRKAYYQDGRDAWLMDAAV